MQSIHRALSEVFDSNYWSATKIVIQLHHHIPSLLNILKEGYIVPSKKKHYSCKFKKFAYMTTQYGTVLSSEDERR